MNSEQMKGLAISVIIIVGVTALFIGTCYWLLYLPSQTEQPVYESNDLVYEDSEYMYYLMVVRPDMHTDGLRHIYDKNGTVLKELCADKRIHIEWRLDRYDKEE